MTSSDSTSALSVLHVEVSSAHLAIDATVVREVLGALEVIRLPGAPRGLTGVVPWNGRAVAALELGVLLGGDASDGARPRTLIVETRSCVLAVGVDRVHEPAPVARSRPAHATRFAHARLEVDLAGRTLPLFAIDDFLRSLEADS